MNRAPSRFFLPGPSWVRPEILEATVRQPIAHRSAAFRSTYGEVTSGLRAVFGTSAPVVMATGSGSLMLEIGMRSLAESRVLALVCGAFSARWLEIAELVGLRVDRLEVPFGESIAPDLVRRALGRARYDAVTTVHCETSTGVLNPIREIAAVVRESSDALVLVDGISSVAGAEVAFDEWGLDFVAAASQKAMALPPGLSFAAVSDRARRRLDGVSDRGYYTDLARYLDHHDRGGTISTPAVPLVFAAAAQLDWIVSEGLEVRWERHRALRDRVLEWAARVGCEPTAPVGVRSPTVTALRPPAGVDAAELVSALGAEGWTVGSGYGPWKPSTFRIGHMGDHRLADLEALLEMCEASFEGLRR